MKKIIALLLIIIMMFANVAIAESDKISENDIVAEVVEQSGDGTVTRAEFARIAIKMFGVSGTAGQAETIFIDVPYYHWASGYIASATTLVQRGVHRGVVQGDGNGNFRPDDAILVEEAIAMLVRTLGYSPAAAGNGGFPNGYAIAAQRVMPGFAFDIEFIFGEHATRELLYELVNRTLDIPMLIPNVTNSYIIADGLDNRPFQTLRTHAWLCLYDLNPLPVYFDGYGFIILDEDDESQ